MTPYSSTIARLRKLYGEPHSDYATKHLADDLARLLHFEETKKNNGILTGGYGFLTEAAKEPYRQRAREEIAKAAAMEPTQ